MIGRRIPAASLLLGLALVAGAPTAARAHPHGGEDEVRAPRYSLFHPVPRGRLRPISTDRPDRTESPYTVDVGHLQVEMDAAVRRHDRRAHETLDGWDLALANLKLGVLPRVDLQCLVETSVRERLVVRLPAQRHETVDSRLGDVVTRLKWNLWGDDAGRTAMALMPFASLRPSSEADFGVIAPFALALPAVSLGTMVQTEWQHIGRYRPRWIGSVTLGRSLAGPFSGYAELWGCRSEVPGEDDTGTFDLGLVYAPHDDVRIDTGVNLGLNAASEDVAAFLGFSVRR